MKKIVFQHKYYLGIDILRMILQFLIIAHHTSDYTKEKNFILEINKRYLSFYTSSFFLISFYFSYKLFNSLNVSKIKERLLRICLPYFIWPLIVVVTVLMKDNETFL